MFDVPATIKLKDLTKPAANEDEFARLLRLARKAIVEGCDIRPIGKGRYVVSRPPRATCSMWWIREIRRAHVPRQVFVSI